MKLVKHNSDEAFLARAKRTVLEMAVHADDPEGYMRRRDAAELTAEQLEKLKDYLRTVGSYLRRAFEADDQEDRAWFVMCARVMLAFYHAPIVGYKGATRVPGMVVGRPDLEIDRLLCAVPLRKMALCRCGEPFFREKSKKYCSDRCTNEARREHKRRSWEKHPEWKKKVGRKKKVSG